MSIVSIKENWSDQTMRASVSGKSATRSFSVYVSDPRNDSPLYVQDHVQGYGDFPREGNCHPDDNWLPFRQCLVERETPYIYRCRALYECQYSRGELSPLDDAPIFTQQWVDCEESVDCDVYGNRLSNVNGDPFYPPPTIEKCDLEITVNRNERNNASYYSGLNYSYSDRINSSPFLGFPSTCVKYVDCQYQNINWDAFRLFNVTYVFLVRMWSDVVTGGTLRGWTTRIFNCGFKEFRDDDIVPIMVGHQLTPVAYPLHPSGRKLTDDEMCNGDGYWRYFDDYETRDFDALGIHAPVWW